MYMNALNSFCCICNLVNTYFDKIIATDSPKSHNPVKNVHFIVKNVHFIQFLSIVLPIMLALCSMLSYYAQNYAGIIGSSLKLCILVLLIYSNMNIMTCAVAVRIIMLT